MRIARAIRVAGLAAIAACSSAPAAPPVAPPDDSNIFARDYVGPAACSECHPGEHARWTTSLHARMNQRATPAAVIGDFAATVAYRDGEVRMSRDGGAYAMTFARPGAAPVRYRVTRTIGLRGLQEYVGVRDGDGVEVRLPFAWWPRGGGWAPQPAFDPWLTDDSFDPFTPVREAWAERCPWCHSTYPFAQRIARASARPVGHGLEQYFAAEPGSDALDVAQQVTVGISCESCHLGGRAHVAGAPIQLVPVGATPRPGAPVPTTFAAERRAPAIVDAVCAQCHSGPSPRFPDGGATRNSSEALDLAASPCTGIRCTDCHDPHQPAASEPRAIAACVGCHDTVADHAGPGHAAATCLDCHMPRIVMGIDRHVRTHRISSPTDAAMLAAGAPNACNLCHLDRSTRWTAGRLGVALKKTKLDLDAPLGPAWLASPLPAVRLVAASAYARTPLTPAARAAIERGLADPLPYVRMWMRFALDDAGR